MSAPAAAPKNLIVLIGGDPHSSDRPAEAIRVAAGIGAWNKVRVSVYLHGPALACATEAPEEMEAGELIAEHLPSILEHGGEICVEKPVKSRLKTTVVKSPARLLASHAASMNFGVPDEALGAELKPASLSGAELYKLLFPAA